LNDCELNTSTVAAKPRANKEKQTFRVKNIEKYNIVRQKQRLLCKQCIF